MAVWQLSRSSGVPRVQHAMCRTHAEGHRRDARKLNAQELVAISTCAALGRAAITLFTVTVAHATVLSGQGKASGVREGLSPWTPRRHFRRMGEVRHAPLYEVRLHAS
jgi:hypothetical protein